MFPGYLLTAVSVLSADLFCKDKIEKQPQEVFPKRLPHGILIERHHNYGFMMNKFDDRPEKVRLVSVLSMIPLGIWTVWLFLKKPFQGDIALPAAKTGSMLLLGGALSNISDRIRRGYVVDFLHFPKFASRIPKAEKLPPVRRIRTLIFNIGDFGIFAGAFITAVSSIFSK